MLHGQARGQEARCSLLSPEPRVPTTHPLRALQWTADAVRATLLPAWDATDRTEGRPSIPPERLLKSRLLLVLSSVPADRLFGEMLDHKSRGGSIGR